MGSVDVNLEGTRESLLDCGKLQDTRWYSDFTGVKIHSAESLQFFFFGISDLLVKINFNYKTKQNKQTKKPKSGNKIIHTTVIITCHENYRKTWNDKNQTLNKLLIEGLGRERGNESVVSS